MQQARARGSYTRLELGETAPATVRVALSPHISLLSLLVEVVGGYDRGLPAPWRRRIAAALPETAAQSAAVLARRGRSVQPDFVVPVSPVREVPAAEQADMLRELPPAVVQAGIEDVFGADVPADWLPVLERPKPWLAGLADGFAAVRLATEELWTRARPLLDREIERIGGAAMRGGAAGALAVLRPQFRYRQGTLLLPDSEPAVYATRGRSLVLVPMIAGPRSAVSSLDEPEAVWIGYGLPGLEDLLRGTEPGPRPDALARVVGGHRAELLRLAARATTMSELAARLACAASTVTYHCEQLASAGLVDRHRDGQTVLVVRTARGDALVELLSGD